MNRATGRTAPCWIQSQATEVHSAEARPGCDVSLFAQTHLPLAEGSVYTPNPGLVAASHREEGWLLSSHLCQAAAGLWQQELGKKKTQPPQASPPLGYVPLPLIHTEENYRGSGADLSSTTFSRSVARATGTPRFPKPRYYLVLYTIGGSYCSKNNGFKPLLPTCFMTNASDVPP